MNELYESFKEHHIIKEGHFKLTSGRHSKTYINKDAAYCIPKVFKEIIINIFYEQKEIEHDVITGPAIAGAILAAPISILTGVEFVYPEKIDGKMVFRRGYDKVLVGKRVLILEDIITTGGSVNKTIQAIETCGGYPVGVIVIWNRSNWTLPDIPVISLINESVESWTEDECQLCKEGKILNDPKQMLEK